MTVNGKVIGLYRIQGEIGRGAMASVHIAKHIKTGEQLCAKIISKQMMMNPDAAAFLKREISIMSSISHENIVKYYSYNEDESNYYIFMEFCPGENLTSYVSKMGTLPIRHVVNIFSQIMSGLEYLHSQHVAHRDLKPDNIIVGTRGSVKLIDFGLATDEAQNLRSSFCGSVSFTSPECLSREPYNAESSDIWSAGIILYYMLAGKLPWRSKDVFQMMNEIIRANIVIPNGIAPGPISTLKAMLNRDPTLRPNASTILATKWLQREHESLVPRTPGPVQGINRRLFTATVNTRSSPAVRPPIQTPHINTRSPRSYYRQGLKTPRISSPATRVRPSYLIQ